MKYILFLIIRVYLSENKLAKKHKHTNTNHMPKLEKKWSKIGEIVKKKEKKEKKNKKNKG